MLTLRHRTASGRLDELWEFDPARQVVELVFRLGAGPVRGFTISVCSPEKTTAFAHALMRRDADTWKILPSLFVPIDQAPSYVIVHGIEVPRTMPLILEAKECRSRRQARVAACNLHEHIGYGMQIVLANAPDEVARELSRVCP